jgi:hypothetical protein
MPECPTRPVARVVVIGAARELETALRVALSPWGVRLERLESQPVQLMLQQKGDGKDALARDLEADALIWLDGTANHRRLRLYEAERGTISTRRVPRGRLNAADSAALALSIKTALRGPRAEQRDAPPEPDDSPPPPAPAPLASVPDDSDSELTSPSVPSALVQLVLGVGLRRGTLAGDRTELRYDAEVRWLPGWARLSDRTSLWLAARFDTGSSTGVASPDFRGEYSELALGLAVGGTHRLGSFVEVGAQLGGSLERASLTGTLLSDAAAASTSRWGASLQLRPEMSFLFGSFAFLLQPAMGVAARAERYRADGAAVLETGHFSWQAGAGLRMNAF